MSSLTFVRCFAFIVVSVSALQVGVAPAAADKRVALVIGNGAYQKVGKLGNPANDAAAIAAMLKNANFDEVKVYQDLGIRAMRQAISEFTRLARSAETAVVYYSGHGMEIDGTNYLLPIDAILDSDEDVPYEAYSLDNLLKGLEPVARLRLVMLDACRDNPFLKSMRRTTRAVGRGLAVVEPTRLNTLIAYAAKAGSYALDGDGTANSPYATALLKYIVTPGLDLRSAFGSVRDDVLKATGYRQEPWTYGSLGGGVISMVEASAAATPPAVTAPPVSGLSEVERAWAATQGTTSVAVLEEFIRRFSDSYYAAVARARLEELKTSSPCGTGAAAAAFSSRRPPCPLFPLEERSLKPKDSFKECDKCPEMVVVPAGRFAMGSPENEAGRDPNEGPQHQVTITKPFAVGKFHVTVDQFAAFVAATSYDAGSKCVAYKDGKWEEQEGRSWRNPGFAQAGNHPAVCLNWNDAKAYVAWLSRETDRSYRLLTEAEWEHAARANSTRRYSFGDKEADLCGYGNGADQTSKSRVPGAQAWTVAPCDDGYAYTSPVGAFSANLFELYDMQGNAWQWVEDCWHDSYTGSSTDGSAWTSGECSRRVVRGGSWFAYPRRLRAAYRNGNSSGIRYYDIGFRVARTLAPPL
jgi:formylglycine-generating enzyme required for sulfatase activity/uncharacterized caspase-like protein